MMCGPPPLGLGAFALIVAAPIATMLALGLALMRAIGRFSRRRAARSSPARGEAGSGWS